MKELEELISNTFQEYPDRFFQRKIKDFIGNLFPDINQTLREKIDKQSKFNPENFGFLSCPDLLMDRIYKWQKSNITIKLFITNNNDYLYEISSLGSITSKNYDGFNCLIPMNFYFGKINNHFEAKILFKNLGLI